MIRGAVIALCLLAALPASADMQARAFAAWWSAVSFSPADLPDLAQWIDFSDTQTLFSDVAGTAATTNGGRIARVNDKSGNARDFVQATTNSRPTRSDGIQGGLTAGYFLAAEFMGLTNGLDIARNVGGFTIVGLYRQEAASGFRGPWFASRGSDELIRARIAQDGAGRHELGGRRLDADNFTTTSNQGPLIGTNAFAVVVGRFNYAGASWQLFVDNQLGGTLTPATSGNTSDTSSEVVEMGRVGAASNFGYQGHILEIAVYRRALSNEELTELYNYLTNKWGISP